MTKAMDTETQRSLNITPTRVEPLNSHEISLSWNDGKRYRLTYVELRFFCPCATCVDEMTGERVIERTSIASDVRPVGVQTVGRYALQFSWSDGHSTGIYPFDKLRDLCAQLGHELNQ